MCSSGDSRSSKYIIMELSCTLLTITFLAYMCTYIMKHQQTRDTGPKCGAYHNIISYAYKNNYVRMHAYSIILLIWSLYVCRSSYIRDCLSENQPT